MGFNPRATRYTDVADNSHPRLRYEAYYRNVTEATLQGKQRLTASTAGARR